MTTREVIFSSEKDFKNKKKRFIAGGYEKIHVISDFDKTLTKAFYEGKKIDSLISRLRDGNYLTQEYYTTARTLFEKYHPIEIDHSIPLEKKAKEMEKWWRKHMELLVKSGLDKKTIKSCVEEMISTGIPSLREGVYEFLTMLYSHSIPLVILSAGLEDLISTYLQGKNLNYENIHIVANGFTFNNHGRVTQIKRITHVFNKNETRLHTLPFYKKLLPRKNVLLLGDGFGDLGMIEGFPYQNLLKVGFLNDNVEGHLPSYKEHFDVVITNDGSFNFVNDLLREICEKD